MVDISIRPAVQADFPAIRSLIHAVRINPVGLDWRRFTLAVGPDGGMIGCGQIKPHGDGSLELASIAVGQEFRGQGAARSIIVHLLAQETRRPLFLTCRARLGPLYAKFGFRPAAASELTPYFRRLKRLASWLNRSTGPGDGLLIMILKGGIHP